MGRALASLVPVGIGDDADPRADGEGVLQQPVEGAPVGMRLDRALQKLVVREEEVGVAAADMRDAKHRPLLGLQHGMQLARIERVRRLVGQVLDEGVAGAMQRAVRFRIEHVAVATERRVPRPFPARHEDEAARLVERLETAVEVGPTLLGDLEVVALVADGIHAREVARIGSQRVDAAGADALAGLAVQVGPEGQQRGIGDAHGVGRRVAPGDDQGIGRLGAQPLDAV